MKEKTRRRRLRPVVPKIACGCACHEDWGGGAHPGEHCSCKGGTGRDPWGPTRGLAEQTKISDAVLEDLRPWPEES